MQKPSVVGWGRLLGGAALGLMGCGGGIPSSPPLTAPTGLRGVVQKAIEGGAVPLTPRPPVIEPLPGATVVVQMAPGGRELARQRADSNGRFTFFLAPGIYRVVALPGVLNLGLIPPSSQTVIVRARQLTSVTLTYRLLAP